MASARLFGVNYFLTWPQNDMAIDVVISNAKELFGQAYKWMVVGVEKHKDGTPHLHCVTVMKKKKHTLFTDLDMITGKRGNYQCSRRLVDCVRYTCKDGEYVADGIDINTYLEAAKGKKNTKTAVVARLVMEGDSLQAILQKEPAFYMMHGPKIKAFKTEYDLMKSQKRKDFTERIMELSELEWNASMTRVIDWLYRNVRVQERKFKKRQLYISGPTNYGKSSFFNKEGLEQYLRIYWVPMNEDYYDFYNDDNYDLIVFDEFKAHKKIQWMNSFVQGGTVCLRIKGGQVLKQKNLPVIILSNYTLEECYHKASAKGDPGFTALKARFNSVELEAPIYRSQDTQEPLEAPTPITS
jgi:Geminivirus Rep catalytic domain